MMGAASSVEAQATWTWVELDPNGLPAASSQFGASVHLNANLIAVGAPGLKQVFVYRVGSSSVDWVQTIDPPASEDGFGSAVYIEPTRLVIGAATYRASGTSEDGATFVYLHNGSEYRFSQRLDPPAPVDGPRFGSEVVAEGTALYTSGPYYARADLSSTQRGAVDEYIADGSGMFSSADSNRYRRLFGASQMMGTSLYFGSSLRFFEGTLAIGNLGGFVPGDPTMIVQPAFVLLFDTASTGMIPALISNPVGPMGNDEFGSAVDLDAEQVFVGARRAQADAGRVYVFDRDSLSVVQMIEGPTTGDLKFGESLDVDGSFMVVGMPAWEDGAAEVGSPGGIELFTRRGTGTWDSLGRVTDLSTDIDQGVGADVSMMGNRVVVSGPYEQGGIGRVWFGEFKLENGEPCGGDFYCRSNACVEGVCCNTRCTGTCESCLAENTRGADGTCAPVAAETDPRAECPDSTCTSTCNGAGACTTCPDVDMGMGDSDGGPDDGGVRDGGTDDAGSAATVPRPSLGCDCHVAPQPGRSLGGVGILALLGLGVLMRRRRRSAVRALFVLAFALSSASAPGAASAQPATPDPDTIEEARQAFERGVQLYEASQFEAASREFQRSYDLSQRPELLMNIYLAHRDMGDVEGAALALRRYLEEAHDIPAEQRRVLVGRLRAMEHTLAERTPEPEPEPGPEPEPDGTSQPEPGSEGTPVTELEVTSESTPESAPLDVPPPEESGSGMSGARIAGLGVAGGAVVPAVLAVVFGLKAGNARSDLYDMCNLGANGDECPATLDTQPFVDDFDRNHRIMTSMTVLSGLMLVGGVVLFVVSPSDDVEASANCGPTGCGANLRVQF